MTTLEALREMLEMAQALRRPAGEIDALRAEIARFEPETVEAIRAKQDAFLSSVR